jgi:biopolymer transport protein ExbD
MDLIEYRPRRRTFIDLTPLVDVVFLLLIFFLVTSQFTEPTAAIDLPAGRAGPEPLLDAIRIEMDDTGRITANGKTIADSELDEFFRAAAAEDPERRVQFFGDEKIEYGRFVGILDRARAAGIADFAIVKKVDPDATAP